MCLVSLNVNGECGGGIGERIAVFGHVAIAEVATMYDFAPHIGFV